MGLFSWFRNEKPELTSEPVVSKSADFSNFNQITDYIYAKSGITDLDKRALTASRLQAYAKENEVYTTSDFLHTMKKDENFYQEVMNIATINESFFLREKKELDWLVSHIINARRELDILVLPCSTGEEVYSILLLLAEKNFDLSKITINGFDLNSQAIKNAKKAEYDEHSLHNVDSTMRAKYFEIDEDQHYTIIPSIRSRAEFHQSNIFEIDTMKKKYDVVLSRNMFIYFDDENRKKALQIIVDLLKVEGIYIKGHADHIEKHDKLLNLTYGIYSKQI